MTAKRCRLVADPAAAAGRLTAAIAAPAVAATFVTAAAAVVGHSNSAVVATMKWTGILEKVYFKFQRLNVGNAAMEAN